jgi:plastocyanin
VRTKILEEERMTLRMSALSMVLLLASCGGGDGGGGGGARPTSTDAGPSADCVESTEITAVDNEFEPICAIAATGDELTVTNEGSAPHTFTIDGTDVDEDLAPGDETTAAVPEGLEVEAENEFHCTIHPSMVGYLYVSA